MSEDKKAILLNCYTDLQRAAVSLSQNPKGKNFAVFFNHALSLLRKFKEKQIREKVKNLKTIRKLAIDPQNKADKILTYGLLLRP